MSRMKHTCRRRRNANAVVAGILATVIGASAQAALARQSGQAVFAEDPNCETAVCLLTVQIDLTGQVRARSVAEAIALGNAMQVRDLGGTEKQAGEAVLRRFDLRLETATPELREGVLTVMNNYRLFFSTTRGQTLEFSDNMAGQVMPGNRTAVGSIIRRGDLDGREKFIWLLSDGGVMGQIPRVQTPIGGGLAVGPPPTIAPPPDNGL